MITKHRNIYVDVTGMTSVCLGERYLGDCMTLHVFQKGS